MDANQAIGMETVYQVVCRDKDGNVRWEAEAKNRVVTAGLNKLLDATFKTGLASPAWFIGLCGASVTDGAMTSGSGALADVSSTPYSALDVGRNIIVRGAGAPSGGSATDLVTTIASFTDSGHVTLTANAGATVSNAAVIFDARAADTMPSHAPWQESSAYSQATRPAFTTGAIAGGSVDNSAAAAAFNINASNVLLGGLFLSDSSTKGGATGTLYGMAPFSGGFRQAQNGDTITVTATLTATAA